MGRFYNYVVEEKENIERWEDYLKSIPMLKHAVDILRNIEKRGYKAYIVGGCVRDIILGKKPKDIDIATNLDIKELEKMFKSKDIGKSKDFGIITVSYGGYNYEIAQFRQDSYVRPKTVRKIIP
jgi:tRNA nucleotidyltransferase/poly(A) polymerase